MRDILISSLIIISTVFISYKYYVLHKKYISLLAFKIKYEPLILTHEYISKKLEEANQIHIIPGADFHEASEEFPKRWN